MKYRDQYSISFAMLQAKAYRQYQLEKKDLCLLTEEDRFLMQLTRVERLSNKLSIMSYMGNFLDNVHLITPQVHAIISASSSVKSSRKLRRLLEVVLAFGNYLNSSKRGPAYGFKLQSLDTLGDTKSSDKRSSLLHYIAETIREKLPDLRTFDTELLHVDKAAMATVRTNAEATQLVSSSGKHHGPHPVTMRTLSLSPPSDRSMVSSTALVCASTLVSSLVQSAVTSVPSSSTELSAPAACVSVPDASLEQDAVTPDASTGSARCLWAMEVADLVAENQQLKHRLLQLEEQYKHVLDHSIESDTRLLHYTNQVFMAATSLVESPVRASVADCAVQCDPPPRASMADCAMQCELTTDCRDRRCADARDLVASLKTTIEVLEAELNSLRGKGSSGCTREQLSECSLPTACITSIEIPCNSQNFQRRSEEREEEKKNKHKTNLPLSSIFIEGDSLVRGLVGHVRWRVARRTRVDGFCNPGAKLLDATSDVPPPGGCCVIVAGTNDVASGQQCNVYRHLEQRIVTRLLTSSVVVSTLPHRHDLPPCHQINQEVELLNAYYIEELCARYCGAVVLDFNQISRSAFTSHGMHLKQSSKHLLADLLIDCVQKLNRSNP
ncbi:Formin-like protein 2 [Homalodisca vitripennis]|nr:Formin-like protein 2 [Homalodisca vitripennis]